jgi:hypothetical protein
MRPEIIARQIRLPSSRTPPGGVARLLTTKSVCQLVPQQLHRQRSRTSGTPPFPPRPPQRVAFGVFRSEGKSSRLGDGRTG